MINFSIITNTRGRLDIFPQICSNIWRYAHSPQEVEHIVMYDYDDIETQDFLKHYITTAPNIRAFGVIPRGDYKNLHDEYWNVAARIAQGKVVFGLCNDTELLTNHYDSIILNEVDEFRCLYGHDICQILVDDDSSNHVNLEEHPLHDYCSWVVLTKSAVNIIQGLVPKEIVSQNGDVFTYAIFSGLKYNALLDLKSKIQTHHISHYTGRRERDRISVGVHINGNKLEPHQIKYYQDLLNLEIERQLGI